MNFLLTKSPGNTSLKVLHLWKRQCAYFTHKGLSCPRARPSKLLKPVTVFCCAIRNWCTGRYKRRNCSSTSYPNSTTSTTLWRICELLLRIPMCRLCIILWQIALLSVKTSSAMWPNYQDGSLRGRHTPEFYADISLCWARSWACSRNRLLKYLRTLSYGPGMLKATPMSCLVHPATAVRAGKCHRKSEDFQGVLKGYFFDFGFLSDSWVYVDFCAFSFGAWTLGCRSTLGSLLNDPENTPNKPLRSFGSFLNHLENTLYKPLRDKEFRGFQEFHKVPAI